MKRSTLIALIVLVAHVASQQTDRHGVVDTAQRHRPTTEKGNENNSNGRTEQILHVADKKIRFRKPSVAEPTTPPLPPTAAAPASGQKPRVPLTSQGPCRKCSPCLKANKCELKYNYPITVTVAGLPCTWRIPASVCHGDCMSYSMPANARSATLRRLGVQFEYSHTCRSCQTVDVIYVERRLHCVGTTTTIRVPQAKACSCRVCPPY